MHACALWIRVPSAGDTWCNPAHAVGAQRAACGPPQDAGLHQSASGELASSRCHVWRARCALQVTKVAQPLEELREVAASDSADTFVLSYTSLLQARAPCRVSAEASRLSRFPKVWGGFA